jgi:hypothetical protein
MTRRWYTERGGRLRPLIGYLKSRMKTYPRAEDAKKRSGEFIIIEEFTGVPFL